MAIRLYFDEDSMSHALVAALRARGVDVLTALEADMMERPDEEQLEFTTSEERALYTFNIQDFYRIHGEFLGHGKSHAGIVLCQQQQFSIGEQMRRLMKLMAALSADDMVDRVEFLAAWG